jgi:hypothetical protein
VRSSEIGWERIKVMKFPEREGEIFLGAIMNSSEREGEIMSFNLHT